MRKKNLMAGLIVVAIFLAVLPSNAPADIYRGAWEPRGDSIFSIDITSSTSTNSFYLYDWGDTIDASNISSEALLIFEDSTLGAVATINFSLTGVNWYASVSGNSNSINLEQTKAFGFLFYDGSVIDSYSLAFLSENAYQLFGDLTGRDMEVIVTNAAPIPIPSTVWIFGAGLIGLVGIRRKLRTN